MQQLLNHIAKTIKLTAEEEAVVLACMREKHIARKEYLLKQDEVCAGNYFIEKGLLRMYTVNDAGTEQMIQFGIENWWLTDYMSMNTGRPSQFFIQAVEHCDLIMLPVQNQEELYAKVPAMERYFRVLMQKALAAAQMRVHFIYNLSGKERYTYFAGLFPDFVQRVPQYMLASYLGFSAEFLSKIRAGKV